MSIKTAEVTTVVFRANELTPPYSAMLSHEFIIINHHHYITYTSRIDENVSLLDMPEEMAERYLNEGFRRGRKTQRFFQLLMIVVQYLRDSDEIDSGLDIDALKVVSSWSKRNAWRQLWFINYYIIT